MKRRKGRKQVKLLTKKILTEATSQYKQGSDMNQLIVAKFFDCQGSFTWYLMNIDPEDKDYCWGIVDGYEVEVGSFSIKELESLIGLFGPRIERDKYWKPIKAIDLWEKLKK